MQSESKKSQSRGIGGLAHIPSAGVDGGDSGGGEGGEDGRAPYCGENNDDGRKIPAGVWLVHKLAKLPRRRPFPDVFSVYKRYQMVALPH
jgi:hypothetical protein